MKGSDKEVVEKILQNYIQKDYEAVKDKSSKMSG